LQYNLLIVQF